MVPGDVIVHLGDSVGFVQFPGTYMHVLPQLSAIAIADVNGDGRPDIVTVSRSENSLAVLINETPANPLFRRGDANGDGSVDVSDAVRLLQVIFGLGPALRISHANINTILKDEGASSSGTMSKSRFRNTMTVVQVALALVLLIGAGLMIQSFWKLVRFVLGRVATSSS